MWGFFFKLIFNKYVLAGIAALALAYGLHLGITSITTAYAERAALQKQTAEQIIEIASMAEQKKLDDKAATEAADKLKAEIDDRDKRTAQQAELSKQLQKDLTRAQANLAHWRATATGALRACLDTPLPDSVQPGAGEAGPPAAAGGKDGIHPS